VYGAHVTQNPNGKLYHGENFFPERDLERNEKVYTIDIPIYTFSRPLISIPINCVPVRRTAGATILLYDEWWWRIRA
jgi:hypothetical protein